MGTDPDILVDLTTAASEFEAGVIVEALRNQGIHAEAFTEAGAMIPIVSIATHPFRVAVRRADLERAQQALRAIKADSVDLDWDDVDTGNKVPEVPGEGPNWGTPRSFLLGFFWFCVVFAIVAFLLWLAYWNKWTPPTDTGRMP